jgi:prepilin-type N-terminal cleavage/methylation domain-containing protein
MTPRSFTQFDRPRCGFTLIELLLVVTIITILVAMLLPAFVKVRGGGYLSDCQSNLKSLVTAYNNYAADNDGRLPGGNTGDPWDWLGDGNTTNSITSGVLWKYVGSMETYKCPNHVYPHYLNSYSVNGRLAGEQVAGPGTSKKYHITRNMNPARQLTFIEEDDNRGWNINSWMLGGGVGSYVDLVPANHEYGDNIGFLDAHVERWEWEDPNLRLRPKHINGAPTFGYNGGAAYTDWPRLNAVFKSW